MSASSKLGIRRESPHCARRRSDGAGAQKQFGLSRVNAAKGAKLAKERLARAADGNLGSELGKRREALDDPSASNAKNGLSPLNCVHSKNTPTPTSTRHAPS